MRKIQTVLFITIAVAMGNARADETPKAEAAAEPKAETPKAEEAKAEAPKAETPTTDVAKAEEKAEPPKTAGKNGIGKNGRNGKKTKEEKKEEADGGFITYENGLTVVNCPFGKRCDTLKGDLFRVVGGPDSNKPKKPTAQYQRVLDTEKAVREAGLTDPNKIKELDRIRDMLKDTDPDDFARLGSIFAMLQNLQPEVRPFRIGATLTAPVGSYSGAEVCIQWEPPKFSEKLGLVFGGNIGLAHFPGVPEGGKMRALYDASATVNYQLGPGQAFLGASVVGASNPFDRSMLGVGPIGGYRWQVKDVWNVDFTAGVPFQKLAWQDKPSVAPMLTVAIMHRIGFDKKPDVALAER